MTPIMMIWSLALFGSLVLLYRQRLEERSIRWRLYALRDQLRDAAFENLVVRNSPVFLDFDRRITGMATMLDDVSYWCLLPVFLMDREGRAEAERRQNALEEAISGPEFEEVRCVQASVAKLTMKHLMWRHLFVSLLAIATIVGALILPLFVWWAAKRIASGAIAIRPAGDVFASGLRTSN